MCTYLRSICQLLQLQLSKTGGSRNILVVSAILTLRNASQCYRVQVAIYSATSFTLTLIKPGRINGIHSKFYRPSDKPKYRNITMKKQYYAVHIGFQTGVYSDWEECKAAYHGCSGGRQMGFTNRQDAEYFVKYGKAPSSISMSSRRVGRKKPKVTRRASVDSSETNDKTGKKLAVVYTDGSALSSGVSEIGSGLIVYLDGKPHSAHYGLYESSATSNKAELNALKAALEMSSDFTDKGYNVEIRTDSKYSLQSISEWAYNWKAKGWKKSDNKTPENLEIIKECHSLYEGLKHCLSLKHVKAHSGIKGNEAADNLAKMAVKDRHDELIKIPVDEVT